VTGLVITTLLALPVAACILFSENGVTISNVGQTASALFAAVVAAAWFAREPGRPAYALAALGCTGWALSNLLWYAAFVAVDADLVPGVADAGFIGFFFFLTAMTAMARPTPSWRSAETISLLVILIGTAVMVPAAALSGEHPWYIALYLLPATVCVINVCRIMDMAPVFAAGTVLYCVAMVANAIREFYNFSSPAWFLDGAVVMAAFPLIVLGTAALSGRKRP
jgi:hypothetical protein